MQDAGRSPSQRLTGQWSWTDHSLISLQYGSLPHHLCRASCSLSDHIRRMFLGLNCWLISGVALGTAPCKWSSPAVHIIIIWHVITILIRLCCYQSTYMIGGGHLMQLSYGSKFYISSILWNKIELPHWIYPRRLLPPYLVAGQGLTWNFCALCPHGLVANGEWEILYQEKYKNIFNRLYINDLLPE